MYRSDSDLDDEIENLLVLEVPQGQQSTDEGGNEDLDDTTESNSSSIIQPDSEHEISPESFTRAIPVA